MKVLSENPPIEFPQTVAHTFHLPQGLIGFADYTQAQLLYVPENLPFLWMKLHSPTATVNFLVIEPGGLIPGYEPELFDEDALALSLRDSGDALVLNIVTLDQAHALDATVNLVGPVIVNRRTRIGRQLVISNYSRYNARHLLVDPVGTASAENALQSA